MKIRQYLTKYLTDNGMFARQAAAVMESLIKSNESMAGRWDDAIEGYPKSLIGGLLVAVRLEATQWIDANQPQAWFRAMFADKVSE